MTVILSQNRRKIKKIHFSKIWNLKISDLIKFILKLFVSIIVGAISLFIMMVVVGLITMILGWYFKLQPTDKWFIIITSFLLLIFTIATYKDVFKKK